MKKIHLSPRLQMAADMVPRCGRGIRLADVGTDHAYLPVWLLQNQAEDRRLAGVIAGDLRRGPLDRARQTAREAECEDEIDFRLCDGLTGVAPEEADVIVIAGMGGETIVHILEDAPWTREGDRTLILQPMSKAIRLRGWLQANGFRIEEERLAQEGETLYSALLARPGWMPTLSPAELLAGKNSAAPLRGAWLDRWDARLRRALEGMARSQETKGTSRYWQMVRIYAELRGMKEEWEQWQK